MTDKPWTLQPDEYDPERASVPIHTRGPNEGHPIQSPPLEVPFVPDPADVDPYAEDEMTIGRDPANRLTESPTWP